MQWYIDRATPDEKHCHRIRSEIIRTDTLFQNVAIVNIGSLGKCLIIDDDLQSSEVDEFIYHEALIQPGLIMHPDPRMVLILGGGEGATLREVLRHKSVERVVLVDVDKDVIELCKEFLPEWNHDCFSDHRVEVVIDDAREYIEKTKEDFDIIISDLVSPMKEGPAGALYTVEFYERLKTKIKKPGIFSLQADSCNLLRIEVAASIIRTLRQVFTLVRPYAVFVPSYDSLWTFATASDDFDPAVLSRSKIDKAIKFRINGHLKFYDGFTHLGMFNLPKYIRESFTKSGRIIEARNPIFVY